jgi:prepilin peptidase CpaA
MTSIITYAIVFLSLGILVAAGLHDAALRTIPNWMPASLAAGGLVLRTHDGNAIPALGIAALLLIILGVLWLRDFIGGGDMKLIPAVALVLPPSGTPAFILSVALAGGVLALLYLALPFFVPRPAPGPRRGFLARVLKAEAWRLHRHGSLPYALAIAGGALPIFIETFSR